MTVWDTCDYEHPGTLLPRLCLPFGPFATLLDVGGGGGTVGQDVWRVDRIDVIDIFPPKTPPRNFRLGNALEIEQIYGAKSFDVVQCAEMIEHLEKSEGAGLLDALESVARRLVVLTTPYGFDKQDPEEYRSEPWADNPYQKHLCGYAPEEFTERGYSILLNGKVGHVGCGSQIIAWKDLRGT